MIFVPVAAKSIDGDDHGGSVIADVTKMAGKIGETDLEISIAMTLERLDRGYDHDHIGASAQNGAYDVAKLFRAKIAGESGFGDRVFSESEGTLGGDHAGTAVSDVSERPTMDECEPTFYGLDDVGAKGIAKQDGHCAVCP